MDGDDAKPAPHSSNGVHISSGGSIGSTGAKGFKGHSLSNPSLPDSGSSTLSSSPDWLQFGNFYDRKQAGSPSLYSASYDDSRPLTLSSNDGMTRAQALQVATEPSQSFFKFLLEPDAAVRAGSLEQLVRLLRDSIQGLGGAGKQQQEPSSSSPSSEADHQAPQHDQAHHDAEARGNGDAPLSSAASPSATANGVDESNRAALILAHLPWVVRLAHACPFDDVRAAFSALINEINDMKLPNFFVPPERGPSSFIPPKIFVPLSSSADQDYDVAQTFQQSFLNTGAVSHLLQAMAWHPSYLVKFYDADNIIMCSPGPLLIPWRDYIGILAASTHNCTYLVRHCEYTFLMNGGDPSWLEGSHNAPTKLRKLLPLNCLLATAPWLIQPSHIEALLRGEDAWTVSELVHALVIIATTHAMSGLVFGLGINLELDLRYFAAQNYHKLGGHAGIEDQSVPSATATTTAAAATATNASEVQPSSSPTDRPSIASETTVQLLQALKGAGNECDDMESTEEEQVFAFRKIGEDDIKTLDDGSPNELFRKYLGDFRLAHSDFDVGSTEYSALRMQDYCWQDHGYALLNRYYSEAAPVLDELFDLIYNLTYHTFSENEDVNTEPFRMAIWHYVHRIKGLFHDDYNYAQVNVWLNRAIKAYVKKLTCAPNTIVKRDFLDMGVALTMQERCHVALLAIEARKQAELVYGLHAIMKYQLGSRSQQ